MLDSIKAWFAEKIEQVLQWIYNFFQWVARKVFNLIMEGLGETIEYAGDMVCVSACVEAIQGISTGLQNLPDVVTFAIPYLHLATGLEMIICAYIVRFVIRRIPIIG